MTLRMEAILQGDETLRQIHAVRQAWFQALKAETRAIKDDYEKTTRTWRTDVFFKTKVKSGPNESYGEVWTGSPTYWFVHESVSVMRGVLSADWSPKTQPRVLSSGAGSGRLLYASKKVSKPPYEARKFTEKIIEDHQPAFQKRMEKVTKDAVK